MHIEIEKWINSKPVLYIYMYIFESLYNKIDIFQKRETKKNENDKKVVWRVYFHLSKREKQ